MGITALAFLYHMELNGSFYLALLRNPLLERLGANYLRAVILTSSQPGRSLPCFFLGSNWSLLMKALIAGLFQRGAVKGKGRLLVSGKCSNKRMK